MSTTGWRTTLVAGGFSLTGQAASVVTGLFETAGGDIQLAVRTGKDGETVILPLQAASQHIVHVRELLLERLRLAGDVLGSDEP